MINRIYKHRCRDKKCDASFYVDDLKVVGAAKCPVCFGSSMYIDEQIIESDERMRTLTDAYELGMITEGLKGIKDIPQGDLNNPVAESIEPLLTIELQDETSVPKVVYKGEEIGPKVRVSFDWETETADVGSGGTLFNIEYIEPIGKQTVLKGYGLRRGKYAYD